jgi:hypothetical protein
MQADPKTFLVTDHRTGAQRLDALEEEMPVVPPSIYDRVELRYQNPAFVDSVVRPSAAAGH